MGTSNDVRAVRRLVRHRRHGCLGLEPLLRGRQGHRLLGRKIRRALGGNRQGLRPGCDRAHRRIRRRASRRSSVEAGAQGEPATPRASSFRRRKPRPARRTTSRPWAGRRQDRRDLRGRCHHRPRHHAARYRRLGPRRRHRRLAEGVHDPAGPGVPRRSARRPGSSARNRQRCRTTTSISRRKRRAATRANRAGRRTRR